MNKISMIILLVFFVALAACSAPDYDTERDRPGPDSDVPNDAEVEEVDEIDQGMDDLGNLDEELNFSDLDGLDEDLQDLEW